MSRFNTSIWNTLTNLIGWFQPLKPPPILCTPSEEEVLREKEKEPISQEWHWMLSTVEEALVRQGEQRSKELQKELSMIKIISPTVKYQKLLIKKSQELFLTLDKEKVKVLSNSRLDASKRDRILRDAVRLVSAELFFELCANIILPYEYDLNDYLTEIRKPKEQVLSSFTSRWFEQPYKKNISGELISMGWRASHIAQERGFTPQVLGDILWSFHLALSREITLDLHLDLLPTEQYSAKLGPLSEQQYEFLCEKIFLLAQPLIELWHETSLRVGSISTREGKLPQQWEEAKKLELERIAELKRVGVTARFNDGPNDPLWRKHLEAVSLQKQPELSEDLIPKKDLQRSESHDSE